MEDRTFELLEKMYAEFSKRFENQDKKIDSIGNELKKIDIKIEHKIEPKIEALFEAKDIIYDRLDKIENKVDNITFKMERQAFEIKVMRGGK